MNSLIDGSNRNRFPNYVIPQREDIEAMTEEGELLQAHIDCSDQHDVVLAQIESNLTIQHDDDDWFRRAGARASFAMAAIRRIERRMAHLGMLSPLSPHALRDRRIAAQNRRIEVLERLIRNHGIILPARETY